MPVVGLEPSCVAVFRDELMNLFPMDEDAKRLSANTFILSEFLEKKAPDFRPPQLRRKALVQEHCHHEHVMKFDAENAVLKKLGLDYELLDSGCCGMAGSFGFEAEHYDVSVAVGERVLLPAVREADARHADHRRRLQLPRADRRPDRPRRAAPGAGPPDGPARGPRRPARSASRTGLSAPGQMVTRLFERREWVHVGRSSVTWQWSSRACPTGTVRSVGIRPSGCGSRYMK